MQEIELDKITPADYNPRKLSDEAFETLKESITTLGVLKPILINAENMVILAGHQRTRAMKALGMKTSPCYLIHGMNKSDEVRFNQVHNLAEYEIHKDAPQMKVTAKLQLGNNRICHKDLIMTQRGYLPVYLRLIDKMLIRYGEFSAPVVIIETGEVIVSAGYAYACYLRKMELDVIAIPGNRRHDVIRYFSATYGTFNYDSIERRTYNQTFAQMFRLRGGKKDNESILYRKMVLPYLNSLPNKGKDLRLLDFGAGQYDYGRFLEKQGYCIHYVDPYHRNTKMEITVADNQSRFLKICDDLKQYGQYDIVICDSVLNSVDTKEAELAVINTVYALTKMQGVIFLAGRKSDDNYFNDKVKSSVVNPKDLIFWLDENGFTGIYRHANWFFQKLHSNEQINAIGSMISTKFELLPQHYVWKMKAIKNVERDEEELIKALRFEFSMMLPNGQKYNLQDEIEDAYRNRKIS